MRSGEVRPGWLTAAACAGMFVFGVVMALLGAVLPPLSVRAGLSLADTGDLFVALNCAMLLASLGTGVLLDRRGARLPLCGGPLAVGAALWLLGAASSYRDALAAAALLGLGGGALNAATNTLVADLHTDERRKSVALNRLGVFFGFGALLLPFSVGALLSNVGLDRLLAAAAGLCASAGLGAGVLRFPPAKQRGAGGVGPLLRVPLVAVLGLLLLCESGNEFLLGGYISTFLTRELALPLATASYALAGFWGATMLARAISRRVLARLAPHRVIALSAALAGAAALTLVLSPWAGLSIPSVAVLGFGLASIYPTALGIAGARFAARSGTVFGILFTFGLTGGMLLPFAAGRIADSAGLRAGLALAPAAFVAIALLACLVPRLSAAVKE